MITKKALKNYLKEQLPHAYQHRKSIEGWLIRRLCKERGTEIESRLNDIVTHGCSSGCVSEVIYDSDCFKFYAKYSGKIWSLVMDALENTGQTLGQFLDSLNAPVEDRSSFKRILVWFAIEETAHRLISELTP